jgi:hypothetical protein
VSWIDIIVAVNLKNYVTPSIPVIKHFVFARDCDSIDLG